MFVVYIGVNLQIISFSAAALLTSLTLNVAKSSIPFGLIKRFKPDGPLKWKKRLVKDVRHWLRSQK